MPGLTEKEKQHYQSLGFAIPAFTLSKAEVDELRQTVDELISNNPEVRPEQLVNAHIARQNAEGVKGAERILELARHPGILDQVESVLGPDFLLWGCQLFCKPAGDGMEVPWHQDGQYWPIRPLATCTVWLAIDDSLVANGCLRVIPGSHQQNQLFEHHSEDRKDIVLTQAVNAQYMQEDTAVDIELKAGQMSLHDVYLIHGSNRNASDRRRAGIAIRYMPTTSTFHRDLIKPSADSGYQIDFSQRPLWLVRGEDRSGNNDFEAGH